MISLQSLQMHHVCYVAQDALATQLVTYAGHFCEVGGGLSHTYAQSGAAMSELMQSCRRSSQWRYHMNISIACMPMATLPCYTIPGIVTQVLVSSWGACD